VGDSLATIRLNQGEVGIRSRGFKGVGRRLIAESRFLSQISPFGIRGGQIGIRTNFFSKYLGFPQAVSSYLCHLPEGQTVENWKTSKNQRSFGNWGILDRNVQSVRIKRARKMRTKMNVKIVILQHEH